GRWRCGAPANMACPTLLDVACAGRSLLCERRPLYRQLHANTTNCEHGSHGIPRDQRRHGGAQSSHFNAGHRLPVWRTPLAGFDVRECLWCKLVGVLAVANVQRDSGSYLALLDAGAAKNPFAIWFCVAGPVIPTAATLRAI